MRIFSTDQKNVPVVFDSGANLTITHSIVDFINSPQPLHMPLFLGGMADGFEAQSLEKFHGHLKHVTIQRCNLSLDGISF